MMEQFMELSRKRHALELALVAPARAAANQMKDAGMHRGADPVMEILFQIDACDQEVVALLKSDPTGALDAVMKMMGRSK